MRILSATMLVSISLTCSLPARAQSAAFTPEQRAAGEAMVSVAARHFAMTLRDPSSAVFRNVTMRRRGEHVSLCGEINARNAFGGYTGFQAFMVLGDDRVDVDRVAGFDVAYLCDNNHPIIDDHDYAPELAIAYAKAGGAEGTRASSSQSIP